MIFVFNGKIKVKILLHVPKTTIKEQPLVLHTTIHECISDSIVLSHTLLLFPYTIVFEGTKHKCFKLKLFISNLSASTNDI